MLAALIDEIEQKKAQLDRLRPLSPGALVNLEHAYDLELTYTSNAIEGNTLTQIETNLVIEQGITIGGKKLRDHLEAIDHYEAIRHVRELAARDAPFHAIGCAQPPRSGGETLGPWNRRRLRHVEPLCEYRQGPAYVPAAF